MWIVSDAPVWCVEVRVMDADGSAEEVLRNVPDIQMSDWVCSACVSSPEHHITSIGIS